MWHFDRANIPLIKRAISTFNRFQNLNSSNDVNWQVNSFTKIISNIMSNFIPNELKKINPREPPWITKAIKNILSKQHRLYKNFRKHGFKPEDKLRVDLFREECKITIAAAKKAYLLKIGVELANPTTSRKSYWKLINKVMNECKAPKIPPIIFDNEIITLCRDKANKLSSTSSS